MIPTVAGTTNRLTIEIASEIEVFSPRMFPLAAILEIVGYSTEVI